MRNLLGSSTGKKKSNVIMTSLIVMIPLLAGSIALLRGGISTAATALINSYQAAYNSEKSVAYEKLYQSAFDHAEEKYHVSNKVIISLGDMEETQRLEVLTVNDVEFMTENRDSNSGKVTAWLEVEGQGTFVIDLRAAEYLVDNDHKYVMVRIPKPELTNIMITKSTERMFLDDFFNESYSKGVDLLVKQRNEASLQIQKTLLSNQYIFSNAKDTSVTMIQNLIKQFNPDIPDLTVEVEFFS